MLTAYYLLQAKPAAARCLQRGHQRAAGAGARHERLRVARLTMAILTPYYLLRVARLTMAILTPYYLLQVPAKNVYECLCAADAMHAGVAINVYVPGLDARYTALA